MDAQEEDEMGRGREFANWLAQTFSKIIGRRRKLISTLAEMVEIPENSRRDFEDNVNFVFSRTEFIPEGVFPLWGKIAYDKQKVHLNEQVAKSWDFIKLKTNPAHGTLVFARQYEIAQKILKD